MYRVTLAVIIFMTALTGTLAEGPAGSTPQPADLVIANRTIITFHASLSSVSPEGSRRVANRPSFAITWMLVSWWPHDNLHAHIGVNSADLLGVEYGFHLTLMIAALTTALYAYSKYTPRKATR